MSSVGLYLTGALVSFACGATTKYAFHRPPLGKSSVVLLVGGGLYVTAGVLINLATILLTAKTVKKALKKTKWDEETKASIGILYLLGTAGLNAVVCAVASKAILGRFNITTSYKEAVPTLLIANIATLFVLIRQNKKRS